MDDIELPKGWVRMDAGAGTVRYVRRYSPGAAGFCAGVAGMLGLVLCWNLAEGVAGWGMVLLAGLGGLAVLVGCAYLFGGKVVLEVDDSGIRYSSGVAGVGRRIELTWKQVEGCRAASMVNLHWSTEEPERLGLSDAQDKWHNSPDKDKVLENVYLEFQLKDGRQLRLNMRDRQEADFFRKCLMDKREACRKRRHTP